MSLSIVPEPRTLGEFIQCHCIGPSQSEIMKRYIIQVG